MATEHILRRPENASGERRIAPLLTTELYSRCQASRWSRWRRSGHLAGFAVGWNQGEQGSRPRPNPLHHVRIVGDGPQRRSNGAHFKGVARRYLLRQKRHGVVEAMAVVAAQEVELAPLIHRLGDAQEDLGKRLNILVLRIVIRTGAGAVGSGVAQCLGSRVGDVLRL